MASLYTTMWTYPWDLRDEGYDVVLGKLKNDVGLDAINLASAYHTFDMLRPHLKGNNTLQVSQAAIYFQPQMGLYANTCVKPAVSAWMGKENWWGRAAEETRRVGLDLTSWTVFFHNSHLAQTYPQCAIVRCTGDVSPSALCPANLDVRAYAIALSRDLVQNYGIHMLECESLDYAGWGHLHFHAKHGVALGEGGRYLLSLCFCDACQKQAIGMGIDFVGLKGAVLQKVRTLFVTGQSIDATVEDLVDEMPELAKLNAMRQQVVTSLVREIREAIQIPMSYILMGDMRVSGANPKEIVAIADRVEILSYTHDPKRTHQAISERLPFLKTPEQLVVGLQAYPPASSDAETLCQNVVTARSLGITAFAFYNYGIMPMPCLDWVAQAIAVAKQ